MTGRIWVTGATGYVGAHVIPPLVARGHDVVALARDPERARRLPQLEGCRFHRGDVLDPASLRGAADGADTVIHLVGILRERGVATFESVVVEGSAAVIAEARRAGARRFLYLSAIGADPADAVGYLRAKGRAEEMVKTSGLQWLILRSSVILGRGGEFLKLLGRLTWPLPITPVPGRGRHALQPVHAADLAEIVARAAERADTWNRVYAVCGPRPYELREMLRLAGGRGARLYVPIPWPLLSAGARLLEWLLPAPPVTRGELAMLARGNTCDPRAVEADFGLRLRAVDGLLAGGDA